MSVAHDPAAGAALHSALIASKEAPPITARQELLTHYLHYYRARNYDSRAFGWDGKRATTGPDRERIAAASFIPPGFVETGGSSLALALRRPDAPYYLARPIVNRFTGLLFSRKRRPVVQVEGDEDSEALLLEAMKAGNFWHAAVRWRTLGGAMGAAALGFRFLRSGKPAFEVFDPRWSTPTFSDEGTGELESLEVCYAYARKLGHEQRWFWYRRVIDGNADTTWLDVPCVQQRDGAFAKPEWNEWAPAACVQHNYGFCPVQWVQNLPVDDATSGDGESDCHGAYETIEQYDVLSTQGDRGAIANCDPTVVISTDADIGELQKGSDNAIKVEKGDDAKYLEISGAGIKLAWDGADRCEARVLRVTQCVLDQARSRAMKTATEVERDYSAMYEKADQLRGQYGEQGMVPLLAAFLRACAVRMKANLPVQLAPRRVEIQGVVRYVPHTLGGSRAVTLLWPQYTDPTPADVNLAVTTAATAMTAGLIDRETAIRYVAVHFGILDPVAMARRLDAAGAAKAEADPYARFVGEGAKVPASSERAPEDDEGAPPSPYGVFSQEEDDLS